MQNPMQYSKSGLSLTQSFEGCKLSAYQDLGGVWSNGYGNTHGVVPGSTITAAQAVIDLDANIQNSVNAVNRLVPIQLTQGQFDALVDFVFNLGINAFANSTMLALIRVGAIAEAADEFEKWDHVGGVEVAGLLRRRKAEEAEFNAN